MSPEDKELAEYYVKEIEGSMDDNDFQFDFFLSLAEQLDKRGRLTDKQMACLKRMYERLTGG